MLHQTIIFGMDVPEVLMMGHALEATECEGRSVILHVRGASSGPETEWTGKPGDINASGIGVGRGPVE